MRKSLLIVLILLILITLSCAKKEEKLPKIEILSPVVKENEVMPDKYTCDGDDISPPLEWSNIPDKTVSFCLIMDDPDAPSGVFTHWLVYNIPSNVNKFNEGIPNIEELISGIKQGKNDFNKIGYSGPCPPSNSTHHYRFKIYAIDKILDLKSGIKVDELMKEIENHILGKGELICIYKH